MSEHTLHHHLLIGTCRTSHLLADLKCSSTVLALADKRQMELVSEYITSLLGLPRNQDNVKPLLETSAVSSSRLESLPNELLTAILQSVTALTDLKAILRASPQCYRVFQASTGLILSSVVRNAASPEVLGLAMAVCDSAELARHLGAQREEAQAKGTQRGRREMTQDIHVQWSSIDLFLYDKKCAAQAYATSRHNKAFWTRLFRLCETVDFFVDRFLHDSRKSMGYLLDEVGPGMHATTTQDLSSVERYRLQMAFLRFELFRRTVFSGHSLTSDRTYHLSLAEKVVNRASPSYLPWEAKQFKCIYVYLCHTTAALLRRFDDEIMEEVRRSTNRSGFDDTSTPLKPLQSKTEKPDRCANGSKISDEVGFGPFTTRSAECRQWCVEELVGYGLPLLRSLLRRKPLESARLVSAFNFKTVSHRVEAPSGSLRETSEQPLRLFSSRAKYGPDGTKPRYNLNAQAHQDRLWQSSPAYTSVQVNDASLFPPKLRDVVGIEQLGYMFWDAERLSSMGFFDREQSARAGQQSRNLQQTHNVEEQYPCSYVAKEALVGLGFGQQAKPDLSTLLQKLEQ